MHSTTVSLASKGSSCQLARGGKSVGFFTWEKLRFDQVNKKNKTGSKNDFICKSFV